MIRSQVTAPSDRNRRGDVTSATRVPNHNAGYLDNISIHDNTSICLSDDTDGEGLDQIIRELDPKHRGVTPPNQAGSDVQSACSSVTATTGHHNPIAENSKASSKDESRPSISTKDSLLSPSTRALQQSQTPYPRRSDFGDYYPDGGWGWVVCGGMFVVHFLAHGLHLAAGTLSMEIMTHFKTPGYYAVWMCSVSYGLSSMLSPFVITICRRKSPRLVALVGGLMTSLACLFMSFSRLDHQLFIAMALVLPLGTGLSLSTASIMLGRYFRKRRECAEMLALCGSGVGMAVVSVFQAQLFSTLSWMRAMQAVAGLMVPTMLAGVVYRSPTIYHPRRKVILHLKTLTKTKKQRLEFENKPPYFDFSPLSMRTVQVLLVSTAVTNVGTYVPFMLLPSEASIDEIPEPSYNLLMVFLGVAFAFGSLVFGLIVVRTNVRCMISRQYLVQLTGVGCGAATLLFTMAHQFHGYALYVWAYGLCCGGFVYTIKVYTYEQVTIKLSERTAGYVTFVQGLPVIFSVPLARWLGDAMGETSHRYGFVFAGVSMLLGATILLLMPWASKHKSNWEVIQTAHLNTGSVDDTMLYDMNVSEDTISRTPKTNNVPAKLYTALNGKGIVGNDGNIISPNACKLATLGVSEDSSWPNIDCMTPMSPTDKVTEFLVHSQNMLQSFSKIHKIELPSVKLEINNQYPSDHDLADHHDEIKDLTLQATVKRNSPYKRSAASRSNATESDKVADAHIHSDAMAIELVNMPEPNMETFRSVRPKCSDSQTTDDSCHSNRPREITTTV